MLLVYVKQGIVPGKVVVYGAEHLLRLGLPFRIQHDGHHGIKQGKVRHLVPLRRLRAAARNRQKKRCAKHNRKDARGEQNPSLTSL